MTPPLIYNYFSQRWYRPMKEKTRARPLASIAINFNRAIIRIIWIDRFSIPIIIFLFFEPNKIDSIGDENNFSIKIKDDLIRCDVVVCSFRSFEPKPCWLMPESWWAALRSMCHACIWSILNFRFDIFLSAVIYCVQRIIPLLYARCCCMAHFFSLSISLNFRHNFSLLRQSTNVWHTNDFKLNFMTESPKNKSHPYGFLSCLSICFESLASMIYTRSREREYSNLLCVCVCTAPRRLINVWRFVSR